MAKDLVRLSVKGQLLVAHDQDAVAVLALQGHLLLDDHHGDARLAVDLAKRLVDQLGACGVKGCGGLVQHQDARSQRQDRRDRNLLLLTARKRGDLAVAQVRDANGGQGLRDALLDLVVGHAVVFKAKQQLVFHDGRDHLGVDVLKHAAHGSRDVGEANLAGIAAVHQHGAKELPRVVVGDGAAHERHQGRLARAGRPNDAHKLAGRDGQRHVA